MHRADDEDFVARMSAIYCTHKSPMRSVSFKRTRKAKVESNNTILDDIRPRTSSLPARNQYTGARYLSPQRARDTNVYDSIAFTKRVRSFETTKKGDVINRGDMFRSSTSIVSSGSSLTEEPLSIKLSSLDSSTDNVSTELTSSPGLVTQFKVALVGASEVGKTALSQQFMTSEYIGGFNTSIDTEQEKVVSLVIDGEETQVSFVENDPGQIVPGYYDAYVIVFSLTCRSSFDFAVDCLYLLRREEGVDTAIILVGNKSDLVRPRVIGNEEGVGAPKAHQQPEKRQRRPDKKSRRFPVSIKNKKMDFKEIEARSVTGTYKCKYVETSALLNVKIDELLVGVVTQIRLKLKERSDDSDCRGQYKDSRCVSPKLSPKTILNKFLCKERGSNSCEDMTIL